jgi:hypothetical protein
MMRRVSLFALVAVAALSACGGGGSSAAVKAQVRWSLQLFDGNVAPSDYRAHFAASFLTAVPDTEVSSVVSQLTPNAPWRLDHYLDGPTSTSAVALLAGTNGSSERMSIRIDAHSHLITELVVHPNGATASSGPQGALATARTHELVTGQLAALRSHFDSIMKIDLSVRKLAESWQQVTGNLGAFRSIGSPIAKTIVAGPLTYFVPVQFASGAIEVQLTFDNNGDVAGLFLRPAGYDKQFG